MLNIRSATATDDATLKAWVRREGLDFTSLKWERFLMAEIGGRLVGMGQVKHYHDCRELGSLIVHPQYRGQGIAAQLIAALEARDGFPLYLLCAARLGPFYTRFGYREIRWREAPGTLRLKTAFALPFRLFGIRVLIMRKDGQTPTCACATRICRA